MNKLELKILNLFKNGENLINMSNLSRKLGVSYGTFCKYIKILEQKGFISKRNLGISGGTTHDVTRQTLITRLK